MELLWAAQTYKSTIMQHRELNILLLKQVNDIMACRELSYHLHLIYMVNHLTIMRLVPIAQKGESYSWQLLSPNAWYVLDSEELYCKLLHLISIKQIIKRIKPLRKKDF